MRVPPQPPLCPVPAHAIIFMQFIGLVSMAATFYHNRLKEVSEENNFSLLLWLDAGKRGWLGTGVFTIREHCTIDPQHIYYPLE